MKISYLLLALVGSYLAAYDIRRAIDKFENPMLFIALTALAILIVSIVIYCIKEFYDNP